MDNMSDVIRAVTAAANEDAPAPTPGASSPNCEQSEETAVTTGDSAQQAPVTNDDNSDARRCVICTEDVAEDDVCWIETFCAPHRHVYHNDCLALWWIEKEQRHCPRCTQDVYVFAVHAQLATGGAVCRVFDAGPYSRGALHEPLLVHSQTRGLEDAMPWYLSANYGWPERCWTAQAAVGQWQIYLWRRRTEAVAVAGMARLRDIGTAWSALEPPPLDGAWSYFEPPRAEGGLVVRDLPALADGATPGQDAMAFYEQRFEEAIAQYREGLVHIERLRRESQEARRLFLEHLEALLVRSRQREGPFTVLLEDIAAQVRREDEGHY